MTSTTQHMKKDPAMMKGLLALAEKPQDNPASLKALERSARYEITPIDHDYAGKTPALWNALHRHCNIDGVMAMMVGNPADVAAILSQFKRDPKYIGGGVGAGFKEEVLPYLKLMPIAKAIGAVNIIKKVAGRLVGDNTDGFGYVKSLEQMFAEQGRTLKGAKILVLGARGSARAISFVLVEKGARVIILNRTESKAVELAKELNDYAGAEVATGGGRSLIPEVLPSQDAVVSTVDDAQSPLDDYSPLASMELPVTPDSIKKNREQTAALLRRAKPKLIVSDIRLRDKETPMLAQARKHKMPVLNGIPMVVNQGGAAFWWVHQKELKERGFTPADIADIMWKEVQL